MVSRLAGAFRRIGRPDAADEVVTTMKAAGYNVRESDPFADWAAAAAPSVGRMYFGRSPQYWMNLQAAYDLAVAERARGEQI